MYKKIATLMLLVLILTTTIYASIPYNPNPNTSKVRFIDIPDKHWAKSTIYKLAGQSTKIISGYADGTFKPDANMTRAEFVTVLVRTLGISVRDDVYSTYADVPLKHWANKYIGIAQQRGIIETTDYGDSFKPDEIISRFEACRMLINSFSRTKLVVNDSSVTMYPAFKDTQKLDQKNKKIVQILYKKGILQGYEDNTAGINKYATRAELSALILRFIVNSDKLENYIVTADDTVQIKPYVDGSGFYNTYKILLPEYTKTVQGYVAKNPGLKERINYLEWFHVDKNYNGKHKTFFDKLKKVYAKRGNEFKLDLNNINVVALNVTISYSGKIDGYWVYDSSSMLRTALISDDIYGTIEPIATTYSEVDLDCNLNNKVNDLDYIRENTRVRTYTLYAFYPKLMTSGTIQIDGGRSMPDTLDYRALILHY